MNNTFNVVWKLRIWTNKQGQDLTESALLAGFVVVVAGAIFPGVANEIREIVSKIPSLMPGAATHGSVK